MPGARRKPGAGSVRRLPCGRYQARRTVNGARPSATFATRAAAEAWLAHGWDRPSRTTILAVPPERAELIADLVRRHIVQMQMRRPRPGRPPELIADLVDFADQCDALALSVDGRAALPPRIYETTLQASIRLGVSEREIRRRIAAGQVPAERVGRVWAVIRPESEYRQ